LARFLSRLVAWISASTRRSEVQILPAQPLNRGIENVSVQLGYRLFDRTTRQVQLSRHGADLLEATSRHLEELDAAMARIGRSARGKRQTVSLGTTPLVAANVLPQAMREYRRRRPDLRVRLFDADQDTVLRQVQTAKLDVGVGLFKSVPGVKRVPFFRSSLVLIRARRHSLTAGGDLPWSGLHGETLIVLSPSSPHQQLVDRQLAKSRVEFEAGGLANLLDTQVALVDADEGSAIIPSFVLALCNGRDVVASRSSTQW